MAANEEFATEVERLYREEEKWEEERENLEGDRLKMEEEKVKLEGERDRLAETVKLVTFDNDRLLTEKLDEKEKHNTTIKVRFFMFGDAIIRDKTTVAGVGSGGSNNMVKC